MVSPAARVPGALCLVLHTHLPWLAHHGRWPVGEEWLYQAWGESYLPVLRALDRLAEDGFRDLVSVAITPVLADQLDDAYCTSAFAAWVADWHERAERLAARGDDAIAEAEMAAAAAVAADTRSPTARLATLADVEAIELVGAPATHPVLPLLDTRTARAAIDVGLDDAALRLGRRPAGLWSPECGWSPDMGPMFAAAGISHVMLAPDQSVNGWPAQIADSSVVGLARDREITDLVWSAQHGYPTGQWYREFHLVDPESGFRLHRVTARDGAKAPYDPQAGMRAADTDARRFVSSVRRRLRHVAAVDGRPGVVVVAYDTELFGHWWHEGAVFLERVLRLLPEAGVATTTLAGAASLAADRRVDPPSGSWGPGADFRAWAGDGVGDLVADARTASARAWSVIDAEAAAGRMAQRRGDLDQLLREVLLQAGSDWTSMITRGQAADYGRRRAAAHRDGAHRIADALATGGVSAATRSAALIREVDGCLPGLDARALALCGAADG